jgi:nitrilase
MTAIISPEGSHVVPPLTQGEGILVADLDMSLIIKRKRMMDSVGHYARPELLQLKLDNRPTAAMQSMAAPHFAPLSFPSIGRDDDEAGRSDADADRAIDQRLAIAGGKAR